MSKTIKLESHHFYRTKFSYRYVLGIFFFNQTQLQWTYKPRKH